MVNVRTVSDSGDCACTSCGLHTTSGSGEPLGDRYKCGLYNACTMKIGDILLPSQKARQLILTPKSPRVCIYVYMPVTVSYRHLARGLEIVSVAIPMASSCSIYLYIVSNSWFMLLPILHCTCGDQFGDWLRQSVCHFLLPVPVKIPPVHRDAG